jgi:hypothetical protein
MWTRNYVRLYTAVILCAACAACGNRREARPPDAETLATKDQDESVTSAAKGPHEPEPSAATKHDGSVASATKELDEPEPSKVSKSEPSQQSADEGIAKVCEKLCQRAAQKCTKQVAGLYRETCNRYEKTKGNCENEIRHALQCQYQATDDLLCAHQADPKCSPVNRELKVCERGTAPGEQTAAEDLTLPSHWVKVRDTQLGFNVAMPPDAELDARNARRTWHAEESGISYYVAVLDPPSGKLNNQALVRTVIAYVGNRCQLRLKLHGELQIKGTTVVQYDSACPDGTEWHGMLHFWNGKAVSTGLHSPAGAKGVLEPFYYSFGVVD